MLQTIILAIIAVELAAILVLATRRRPRCNRGSSPVFGNLKIMSKIIHVGGAGTTASVAYVNKEGAAASVVGAPVWSVTPGDGSIIALTAAADGMSASISAVAVGDATITVTAEGDETAGVDTITLTADVSVAAEEATGGAISFA